MNDPFDPEVNEYGLCTEVEFVSFCKRFDLPWELLPPRPDEQWLDITTGHLYRYNGHDFFEPDIASANPAPDTIKYIKGKPVPLARVRWTPVALYQLLATRTASIRADYVVTLDRELAKRGIKFELGKQPLGLTFEILNDVAPMVEQWEAEKKASDAAQQGTKSKSRKKSKEVEAEPADTTPPCSQPVPLPAGGITDPKAFSQWLHGLPADEAPFYGVEVAESGDRTYDIDTVLELAESGMNIPGVTPREKVA